MNYTLKFLLCMLAFIAITIADSILFVQGALDLPVFIVILFASLIVLFIPFILFRGAEVKLSDDSMWLKGMFVDKDIPFDSIKAIEFRESFRPGIKVFGYRGLKRGSGDFSNEEFGQVRFVGDTSIPAFILFSVSDRIVVFNYRDAETTRQIFDEMQKHIQGNGSSLSQCIDREAFEKRRRKARRGLIIFIAGITVTIVAVVAILMFSAHVNITLTDEGIDIDASMENELIRYGDIRTVELREEFDIGSKVMGYGGFRIDSGKFRNSEFGDYRLAIYKDVHRYIVVEKTDGDHVVFNCSNVGDTEKMYEDILTRKNGHSILPIYNSEISCYV